MILEEFEEIARRLIGQQCWAVIPGPQPGIIYLQLGEKIARKEPLDDECLTDVERLYVGEYIVNIECSRRLESDSEVVMSWTETEIEPWKLELLLGAELINIQIIPPCWDTTFQFSNAIHLRL